MPDMNQIIEKLSNLNVMDAVKLSKMLEEQWGVSASPVVAEQTIAPVVDVPKEIQTEFSVILNEVAPDKKITVIKEVRTITGLGLKEAKDFTEQAMETHNKVLKESVTKEEAEALKLRVEEAGGKVSIQ